MEKIKITHKLWAKIIAVVLCLISALILAISTAATYVIIITGLYNDLGTLSEDKLEDYFLENIYDGYLVSDICESLTLRIDTWQLFYDKDEVISLTQNYLENYYDLEVDGYSIRVEALDGTYLCGYELDEETEGVDERTCQIVLSSSLEQFIDRYGWEESYLVYYEDYSYDDYLAELYALEEEWDAEDLYELMEDDEDYTEDLYELTEDDYENFISEMIFESSVFTLYDGEYTYEIFTSDNLGIYMSMADAFDFLGSDTVMKLIYDEKAYVYSDDLTSDITDTVEDLYDLRGLDGSEKLVLDNLHSQLSSGERSLNITVYIDRASVLSDLEVDYTMFTTMYNLRYIMPAILIVCIIVLLSAFTFLLFACGHSGSTNEIQLNVIDRIPTDLYLLIMGMLLVLVIYLARPADSAIYIVGACYGIFIILFGTILSCATRLKARTFLRSALTVRLGLWIKKGLSIIIGGLPLIWKGGILLGAVFCLNVVACAESFLGAIGIVINLAFLVIALIFLAGCKKIQLAAEKMAQGDLEYQLDTKNLYGELKRFGETMGRIRSSLGKAVHEQMKNERMKTELITNVSHDIKTPLTSIINYVDLLKKEELKSETARQYVEVIDRQSAKMKKLIVDLIEVSRANTGNIDVNLAPTNVNELLLQTTAEYEKKMQEKNLEMNLNLLPEPGMILADARHIWRVMDNILSNACKYSLEGTRIYIDINRYEGQINISIKNISSSRLNVSADELMERFVRGDSSRNTEGSGLGLSIAKSLTELQGGRYMMEIDGDLFKTVLSFSEIRQ